MTNTEQGRATVLSLIIPCYNEERTLENCVKRILAIADDALSLELIIVDDHSDDNSYNIATELKHRHPEITVHRHDRNFGKGAALRTGFKAATGDFVAIQDADLEYDPNDLKRLIEPLTAGQADVVLGSRFISAGAHRVLYFWHYMGNRFLTFLSNMFTDLNLTDLETCYKVFRRDIIQSIDIQENRFGFEPEIVAKIAQLRLRVFEMGISYYGRTYAEGKKIGAKDGFRTLYCIFRYNAHKAPLPVQLMLYLMIGGLAAIVNFLIFFSLFSSGIMLVVAGPTAFILAAVVNYFLCISILFKHKARWNSTTEAGLYVLLVALVGCLDLGMTKLLMAWQLGPWSSKLIATITLFVINFIGRRFLIFHEPAAGPWLPQNQNHR